MGEALRVSRESRGDILGPVFGRHDWMAFLTVFSVSLILFVSTLAPSVTLEASGELIVAADTLGVPHPPGYPLWTLLAWLFKTLFRGVTYQGHPNPAWGVAFMSAFFGALASGLIALLASGTSRRVLKYEWSGAVFDERTVSAVCFIGAVSAGLAFSVTSFFWSQCVIAEVHSLNVFLCLLVFALVYRWFCRPGRYRPLYLAAFLVGALATNGCRWQLLLPALLVLVWAVRRRVFFEMLVVACLAVFVVVVFPGIYLFDELRWSCRSILTEMAICGGILVAVIWPLRSLFFRMLRGLLICVLVVVLWTYLARNWSISWGDEFGWNSRSIPIWLVMGGGVLVTLGWRLRRSFPRLLGLMILTASLALFGFASWLLVSHCQEKGFRLDWYRLFHLGIPWIGGLALVLLGCSWRSVERRTNRPIWIRAGFGLLALVNLGVILGAIVSGNVSVVMVQALVAVFLLDMLTAYLSIGFLFPECRRMLWVLLFGVMGLTLWAYLPLASSRNPPMNWGNAQVWCNFKHLIGRGSYQHWNPRWAPAELWNQLSEFMRLLAEQFSPGLIVLGVIGLGGGFWVARRMRWWWGSMLLAFFFFGPMFAELVAGDHSVHTIFMNRTNFILPFAVFSLWIGYGLVLGLAGLHRFIPFRRTILVLGACLGLLIPGLVFYRSYWSKTMLSRFGGPEQNGHDFGWQLGSLQLNGAKGLRAAAAGEPPMPDPDYPPAMSSGSIFFAGTDSGRFVNTYMIFSAKVRPDVFLLTQNALADNTYLEGMRSLYGDAIWIPATQDSNQAFKQYLDDIKAGRNPGSTNIIMDARGSVRVQGVSGIMVINGIIAGMIVEKNKAGREFYVEESYAIEWMYPYLSPHGLIMKLNSEPLSGLTPRMVKDDMDYWNWTVQRLMGNPKFRRDAVALEAFSKLRCAIAGIYGFRKMFPEAEDACKQAIELSPVSPGPSFRLAELYREREQFEDARKVMSDNYKLDSKNKLTEAILKQNNQMEQAEKRIMELQIALSTNGISEASLELARLYQMRGKEKPFRDLTRQILDSTNVPPSAYLEIAKMWKRVFPPQLDQVVVAYHRYLRREPADAQIWLELSCA
ncbi:MAG: DUF2723 domain-containing protein, partial [Lentisphaerae bacterium]|nr:DUF2723 domain-containing protein [Lentisphaerota bacterium]